MNEISTRNGSPPRAKRPRHSGSLFQRGHTWYIAYSRNGRQFTESSHSRRKNVAENLLKHRLSQITTAEFIPPQKEKILLEELAPDLFIDYENNERHTVADVRRNWQMHLEPFFRGWRAIDVRGDVIARYVAKRQQEDARPATINRELSVLGRMFALARKHGKVRDIPVIEKLRENNRRTGFLQDGDHRKIVEFCPQLWFRTVVEIGRSYGWRISEVLNLKVKQIDLFSKTIRLEVGETKNGEGREVPMTAALFELLRECVRRKEPEAAVFTRSNGKPVRDIRSVWFQACVHAGLANLHCPECNGIVDAARHCPRCGRKWQLNQCRYRGLLFHDLRRTAARNLRRSGVAEEVIMKIGGWKTASVFKRYSIVGGDDIREAMTKMQQREQSVESARLSSTAVLLQSSEKAAVADKAQIN
jgi:integrase